MKALLLKDWYVLWKQTRFFFLYVLIFSMIPGVYYNLFAVCYASMLPYTAMAYDERSHWNQLSAMMPYSVRDLVLSRYVIGWCSVLGAGMLSLLSPLVGALLHLDKFLHLGNFSWNIVPLSVAASGMILAVMLPLMFRFGVERARLMVLFFIVLASAGCTAISIAVTPSMGGELPQLFPLWKWILLLISIAANVVSVRISMNLYQRRAQ